MMPTQSMCKLLAVLLSSRPDVLESLAVGFRLDHLRLIPTSRAAGEHAPRESFVHSMTKGVSCRLQDALKCRYPAAKKKKKISP
jgi:hypothetical protein